MKETEAVGTDFWPGYRFFECERERLDELRAIVGCPENRPLVIDPVMGNYGLEGFVLTVNGSPPHGMMVWFPRIEELLVLPVGHRRRLRRINTYGYGKPRRELTAIKRLFEELDLGQQRHGTRGDFRRVVYAESVP